MLNRLQISTTGEMEEVPVSQMQGRIAEVVPQEEFSERIPKQIEEIPVRRIMDKMRKVIQVEPQEQLQERILGKIVEQIVDVPVFANTGTDRWGEQDDLSGASLGLHRGSRPRVLTCRKSWRRSSSCLKSESRSTIGDTAKMCCRGVGGWVEREGSRE